MIKAIATDLDGTLFYPKRKIRLLKSQNKKFLKKLIEENIEVVLVTGRNRIILTKMERKLKSKINLSMIGCSGSFTVHKDEIINERPLNKDKIKKLLELIDSDKDIKSTVFMGNWEGMLIDPSHLSLMLVPFALLGLRAQGVYYEKSRFGRKRILKELANEESKFYKVMPIFGFGDSTKKGMQKAKEWAEKMRGILGDEYEFFESGTAVEIVAKGTNKAKSLEELFQKYNISKDEVLVVGDSGNDIPMLEAFPNSFAMNNAPDYVKKHAKKVIKYVYELEEYMKTTE